MSGGALPAAAVVVLDKDTLRARGRVHRRRTREHDVDDEVDDDEAEDEDEEEDEEEDEDEDEDRHDEGEDVMVDGRVGMQAAGFQGLAVSGWLRLYTLTLTLVDALSSSWLWVYRLLLMLAFILFLLPGFIRVALFYTLSKRIKRNVVRLPRARAARVSE